jgi:hypothetical protein
MQVGTDYRDQGRVMHFPKLQRAGHLADYLTDITLTAVTILVDW